MIFFRVCACVCVEVCVCELMPQPTCRVTCGHLLDNLLEGILFLRVRWSGWAAGAFTQGSCSAAVLKKFLLLPSTPAPISLSLFSFPPFLSSSLLFLPLVEGGEDPERCLQLTPESFHVSSVRLDVSWRPVNCQCCLPEMACSTQDGPANRVKVMEITWR